MRLPFINAVPVVATVFGPDPHNPAAAIVGDAWLRLHGGLVAFVGGGDTDPSNRYFGDLGHEFQSFTGAANLIGTGSLYRTQPTIAQDGNATMADPARQALLDRLRRGAQL